MQSDPVFIGPPGMIGSVRLFVLGLVLCVYVCVLCVFSLGCCCELVVLVVSTIDCLERLVYCVLS